MTQELVIHLNYEGEDYEYDYQIDQAIDDDLAVTVGFGVLFHHQWTLDMNMDDYHLVMTLDGHTIFDEQTPEAP